MSSPKKINLILIRHARTSYSNLGKYMGSDLDISCTSESEITCNKLHYELRHLNIHKIYASPMKRTWQSAKWIFQTDIFECSDLIKERGLGSWAGLEKNKVKKDYPEAFLKNGSIDPDYTPLNGESMKDMIIRLEKFLSILKVELENIQNSKSKDNTVNIAIVTHNGVIRTLKFLFKEIIYNDIFLKSEGFLEPTYFTYNSGNWRESDSF